MSVRVNLNLGDDLDAWVNEKAKSLGIAKNAYIIMCVANARQQEENLKMMSNMDLFNQLVESSNSEV